MKRTIEKRIFKSLAQLLLDGMKRANSSFETELVQGKFIFTAK